jgi:dTDP-4-amino-4,6-dideoxygalactose transaminase
MSFNKILKFEQALAEFTGAPYAIMTDCCTHAIEMCLLYDKITECTFTPYTYLSIPMTMHKLGIKYTYLEHKWQRWVGEYPIIGTRIWDSARRLQKDMYRSETLTCLSFGYGKPLQIGRGGAILLDDVVAYETILQQRADGRDLTITPWESQKTFKVGYHYKPTIEEATQAMALLEGVKEQNPEPKFVQYPDLRQIIIKD